MANSSRLVLPTTTAPAARSRSTTVASYGGRQPSRIREAARRRHAPSAQVVLQRDRHTGQRPGILPGGHGGVDPIGRGQGLVGEHLEERVDVAVAGRHGGQRRLDDRPGRPFTGSDGRRHCRGRTEPGAAHGASPTMRGTRNRSSSTVRRGGQHRRPVEAGPRLVGPEHVAHGQRVGGRRHAGQIEGGHVVGVLDHLGKLAGEGVELLVRQGQAGEPGHVGHVVPAQPARATVAGHAHASAPAVTPTTNDTVRASTSSRS